MESAKIIKKLLKVTRGVATSLIEATATVAVGAVLAGVAVGSAAIADVSVIGQGGITFYKDNSFFPLFKVGNATGPNDTFFNNLVSQNGTYPTLDASISGSWDIPASGTNYSSGSARFGHRVDSNDDTLEGHLVTNNLAATSSQSGSPLADDDLTFTSTEFYPIRSNIPGNPQRGWSGPYIETLSSTDPWSNKYLINVRMLHVGFFQSTAGTTLFGTDETLPEIAVIVISAGPNRALEDFRRPAG